MDSALVLQTRVRAVPFDQRCDRLDAPDAGVVAVHDLHLPAAGLGVPLVHPEELGREERGLLSSGARADLDEDVARIVRVAWDEEELQLPFDLSEPFGQAGALRGGHLVELFARGERLDELARALELPGDPAVLFVLRDDRLELGERLLRVAHGAMILDELRVREPDAELFVLSADLFEFREHKKLSVVSSQLSGWSETASQARER